MAHSIDNSAFKGDNVTSQLGSVLICESYLTHILRHKISLPASLLFSFFFVMIHIIAPSISMMLIPITISAISYLSRCQTKMKILINRPLMTPVKLRMRHVFAVIQAPALLDLANGILNISRVIKCSLIRTRKLKALPFLTCNSGCKVTGPSGEPSVRI